MVYHWIKDNARKEKEASALALEGKQGNALAEGEHVRVHNAPHGRGNKFGS
jgi:hypothetical protein